MGLSISSVITVVFIFEFSPILLSFSHPSPSPLFLLFTLPTFPPLPSLPSSHPFLTLQLFSSFFFTPPPLPLSFPARFSPPFPPIPRFSYLPRPPLSLPSFRHDPFPPLFSPPPTPPSNFPDTPPLSTRLNGFFFYHSLLEFLAGLVYMTVFFHKTYHFTSIIAKLFSTLPSGLLEGTQGEVLFAPGCTPALHCTSRALATLPGCH